MNYAQMEQRINARISSLKDRGQLICPEFTERAELPRACATCGYEADVHLLRDAILIFKYRELLEQ